MFSPLCLVGEEGRHRFMSAIGRMQSVENVQPPLGQISNDGAKPSGLRE